MQVNKDFLILLFKVVVSVLQEPILLWRPVKGKATLAISHVEAMRRKFAGAV